MNVMDLFRLDGKVALVTGGAGIYGTHISDALAEAGATVLIAARTLEKCEKKAQQLRDAGYKADAFRLDLTSEESVLALRDAIWDKYGKLDVLFNNSVARVPDCPPFEKVTVQQWEDVMRVNSTGLFLACRTFGSAMVEQGSGSIVNIASIYGVVGPDFGIYGRDVLRAEGAGQFHKSRRIWNGGPASGVRKELLRPNPLGTACRS